MSEIIPTVVPKSISDIEALAARFAGVAATLHIDATDGDFAFPTTWLPKPGDTLPPFDGIYEAHAMVQDPRSIGERFARLGVWRIIAHLESLGSDDEALNTIALWKLAGAKETGVALLIETSLDRLDVLVPHIDVVHLMSIKKIGSQGQELYKGIFDRVREVRRRFPHISISIDGGVNEENIAELMRAGATRLCIGSALAQSEDAIQSFKTLTMLSQSAVQ